MKKKIISFLTAFCLMLTMLYMPSDLFDIPGKLVAYAAGHTKHSVCVGTTCTDPDHANHKEIDWRSWTSKNTLPSNGGFYYLENNVEVKYLTEIAKDTTICLNRYTITMTSTSTPMFTISPGVTLTICDCSGGNGKLTGAGGNGGDYTLLKVNGTLNLYSGTITGNKYDWAPVLVEGSGACFNMYGGSISDNHANPKGSGHGGGAVSVNGSDCIFNMYGGIISGNSTVYYGGGIYSRGTVNIYGGTISENTGDNIAGGIYMQGGTLLLAGGEIINNNDKGGVVIDHKGTFTMSGGKISGNKSSSRNGGVQVRSNCKFIMSGGEITDNRICGVFVYGEGATLTLNGSINISNNGGDYYNPSDVWIDSGEGRIEIGENFQTNSPIVIETDVRDCYNPRIFAVNVTTDLRDWFVPAKNKHYISYEDETDTLTEHIPHTFKTDFKYDADYHWHECGDYSWCKGESEHEEHSFTTNVTAAATCTAEGSQTLTCECGYSKTETIPLKGHTLTYTAAKDATCTANGNIEYWYCSVCKKYFKNSTCTTETTQSGTVINKKGHTEVPIPAVAATCTATGLTAGKKCSVCGVVTKAQTVTGTIPHTWSSNYEHNASNHWKICAVCGAENTRSGHSWNSGTETKPATEYAAGEKLYTCTVCGETKTEVIPKLAHTHKWSTGWSSDENYHWHVCTECSAHQSDIAHAWAAGEVIEQPTCTETGSQNYSCSVCGAAKTETIAAKGHTEETIPEVDATCTDTGLTEGKKCSVCNTLLTGQATIDALGHDWDAGKVTTAPNCTDTGVKTFKCDRCGEEKIEEIPANGHIEVIDNAVAATCTDTGLTEGKHCSVCSDVLVEQTTVEALGHDWIEGAVVKEPNCTDTGVKTFKCNRCGEEKTEEIPAKGHTEETIPAVAAACTSTGLTEGKKCSVCHVITVEQTSVEALGHKWNKGEVIVPPTENTPGTKKFTCTVCGETQSEQIPMGKITTESSSGEGAPMTELKTSPEELIEAALSLEEKNIIRDGTDINIILKVDDASETAPKEDKQKVETQISGLSDCKLGQYLDVRLLKIIGSSETPITKTKEKITVTFEIPANLRGKNEYSVIRVHDGLTTVLKDLDSDPGTITIETDQFSTYALVYVEKTSKPSRPSGGGSHYDPSWSKPAESGASDTSESKPAESGTSDTSESKPAESGTSDTSGSKPAESGAFDTSESKPDESGASDTSESKPAESSASDTSGSKPAESEYITPDSGGESSDDTTASPVDQTSLTGTSSGNTDNPATGMAVSFIPMLMALAGVTAAAKHRRK